MHVTCAQCRTTYFLADELVAPGGTPVQCTRCQHTFLANRPPAAMENTQLRVICNGCWTTFSLDSALVPAAGATVQCSTCDHTFWLPPPESDRGVQSSTVVGTSPAPERTDPRRTLRLFSSAASQSRPHPPQPELSRLDHLYQRVAAAPDDDAPRQVLADQLTELGDPRGEFIAIQLAEPNGPTGLAKGRARELERHVAAWVPPGVNSLTASFKRGFLHACEWQGPTDPKHPGWLTVERLLCVRGLPAFDRQTLFLGDGLPALKELRNADAAAFAGCASRRRDRIEVLHTFGVPFGEIASRVHDVAQFPALHTLELHGTALSVDSVVFLCRALALPTAVRRLCLDGPAFELPRDGSIPPSVTVRFEPRVPSPSGRGSG